MMVKFVILDCIVLLCAGFLNCFALHSVIKADFSLKAYRRFLISLVASDLLLCSTHLAHFVNQALADSIGESEFQQHVCITNFLRSLLLVGVFANLFNLCGMSIDHFIGIVYPMRYSYITSKGIVKSGIAIVWVMAFICGFADVPIVSVMYYLNGTATVPSAMISDDDTNCSSSRFNVTSDTLQRIEKLSTSSESKMMKATNRLIYSTIPELDEIELPELAKIIENHLNTLNINTSASTNERPCQLGINSKEKQFKMEWDRYQSRNPPDDGVASRNWCVFSNSHKIWIELFAVFWALICYVFLIICYGKIFKKVAEHMKDRSIRKLVVTTCLLLGIFALCWLPFMGFEIIMWAVVSGETNYQAAPYSDGLLNLHNIFNTLFILGPFLNPIIYVARLQNIQRFLQKQYAWLWRQNKSRSNNQQLLSRFSRRQSQSSPAMFGQSCPQNFETEIMSVSETGGGYGSTNPTSQRPPAKHHVVTTMVLSSAGTNLMRHSIILKPQNNLNRVTSNMLDYLREESTFNRHQENI